MIKPQCIIRIDVRKKLVYEEATDQPEWPHELPGDHFTYEVITPAEDFHNETALRRGLNFAFTNWDLEKSHPHSPAPIKISIINIHFKIALNESSSTVLVYYNVLATMLSLDTYLTI